MSVHLTDAAAPRPPFWVRLRGRLRNLAPFATLLALVALFSALTVIHGQSVAIGDTTGQVAPPSYSVSGSLSPEQ